MDCKIELLGYKPEELSGAKGFLETQNPYDFSVEVVADENTAPSEKSRLVRIIFQSDALFDTQMRHVVYRVGEFFAGKLRRDCLIEKQLKVGEKIVRSSLTTVHTLGNRR